MTTPNGNDDTSSPSPLCQASNGSLAYMGSRRKGMVPGIYERKYELDSLLAFLKLGRMLHEATGSTAPFDDRWLTAVGSVLDVLEAEQMSSAEDASGPCGPAYSFTRSDISGQGPLDTLLHGVGTPVRRTGMIRSAFRPSDDACTFGFLVPANAMAVVELRRTAKLIFTLGQAPGWRGENEDKLAQRCNALADAIDEGITKFGTVTRAELGGAVYAYEVDGFGNAILMDDANVPSLLSLPWLGYVEASDPIYQRTRAYVLSNASNPWYFAGSAGEGIGGPHVGTNAVWPMAIIMRALTSTSDAEIAAALATLKRSAIQPGSWLMHESFSKDDFATFTRPWFAWSNSLFGELVLKLSRERPHLVGIS